MCLNHCDPARLALLSLLVREDHGKSSSFWEAPHWSRLPHTLPQERQTDDLIKKFKEMWLWLFLFLPNMTGRETGERGLISGGLLWEQGCGFWGMVLGSAAGSFPILEAGPSPHCTFLVTVCSALQIALPSPGQSHPQESRRSFSWQPNVDVPVLLYRQCRFRFLFYQGFVICHWKVSSRGRRFDPFYLYILIEALGSFLGSQTLLCNS